MAEEARRHDVAAIAAVGTAGLRIGSQQRGVRRRRPGAVRVVVEIISGEEEARLAYLATVAGIGRAAGRASCSTPVVGARSSRSDAATRSSERFSVDVGAVRFTERFGLDGAVSEQVLSEALDGHRRRPRPPRRPARSRRARRHGRGGHQPRRGRARPRRVRPGRRAGHGARPGRDRPADRALPHPRRRRAPHASSASSPSAPTSSWPVPASCGRCSTSSARTRSRSATAVCGTACSSDRFGQRGLNAASAPGRHGSAGRGSVQRSS